MTAYPHIPDLRQHQSQGVVSPLSGAGQISADSGRVRHESAYTISDEYSQFDQNPLRSQLSIYIHSIPSTGWTRPMHACGRLSCFGAKPRDRGAGGSFSTEMRGWIAKLELTVTKWVATRRKFTATSEASRGYTLAEGVPRIMQLVSGQKMSDAPTTLERDGASERGRRRINSGASFSRPFIIYDTEPLKIVLRV
jgi:hypothetical protein